MVVAHKKVTETAAIMEGSTKTSIGMVSQEADVSYGSAHKAVEKM